MKYKGKEIITPTLAMVKEYIAIKGFCLDAETVFNRYQERKWLTTKGTPVTSIEAVVNSYNGIILEKERLKQKKDQQKKNRQERKKQRREKRELKKKEKEKEQKNKKKKNTPDHPKIKYAKQLEDVRWKEYREKVLDIRGRQCEICGNKHYLQIHHLKYEQGIYAWEYSIDDVIVLCCKCHKAIHGIE